MARDMADILLIQPPIRDFYLTAKRTVPYGLAAIAAVLRTEGFSVQILDGLSRSGSRRLSIPDELAHLEPYYGRPDRSPFALFQFYQHFGYGLDFIGRTARDSGAFLVGISAMFTPYVDMALATAAAVKEHHPECRIVLGGHHATSLPQSVMASPHVDFVLRGEGEAGMVPLARALASRGALDDIPGLVSRRPHGGLEISPRAVVRDLDSLPPPALDLLDGRPYRRKGGGSAVVVASRGCPMRCSYCCVGAQSGQPYRRRSVAGVLAEMEVAVREHGARFIDFEDENLALEPLWFTELLSGIRQRFGNLKVELRAMNGLFPPSLSAEVVEAMRAAGFRALNLSLGTTCREQLRRFRRPPVGKAFDKCLQWAAANGLEAVGYIVVGAPNQSPSSSVADLLYLARRRVLAGVSVFYPSPGSLDYHVCRRLGILPESFAAMRGSALPIDQATTRTDSATLLRLGRLLNFAKYLVDRDVPLPDPRPVSDAGLDPQDRIRTGRALLAGFFHDGLVRGITPEGDIYPHLISPELAAIFRRGMQDGRIRGCRT